MRGMVTTTYQVHFTPQTVYLINRFIRTQIMIRKMVTVIDRQYWGSPNTPYPLVRTIVLDWVCPQCGGPRGKLSSRHQYESGTSFYINIWQNPCGHLDLYADVIKEADNKKSKHTAANPAA